MRLAENLRMNGGSSTPSICTRSWLSAIPPPMPPMPPGIMAPWSAAPTACTMGG